MKNKGVATRTTYRKAVENIDVDMADVSKRAEQQARTTGKLEPLVDPAGFGVIRLSLPRMVKHDKFWKLAVGTPKPIETRVDTTSSMGGELNTALQVLPDAFESWAKVLPGYDLQIATGIFGDVCDRFVLCRPQFEMDAAKIVKQLTLMVPERGGGDMPEDPDLGIFGGAYLCRHYINRIGLKGYDFTVTDAPGRGLVSEDTLRRVYGGDVFERVSENGHEVPRGPISLSDIWEVLLDRAHGFILQVPIRGRYISETTYFWRDIVGNRLVKLPETKYLPHVQATLIGLTEGTVTLASVEDFLGEMNVPQDMTKKISEAVANVPIGLETLAQNFDKRPVKGDLFEEKPDVWEDKNLWPVGKAEEEETTEIEKDQWL